MFSLTLVHLALLTKYCKEENRHNLWISVFLLGILVMMLVIFFSFGTRSYDSGMSEDFLTLYKYFRVAATIVLLQN